MQHLLFEKVKSVESFLGVVSGVEKFVSQTDIMSF